MGIEAFTPNMFMERCFTPTFSFESKALALLFTIQVHICRYLTDILLVLDFFIIRYDDNGKRSALQWSKIQRISFALHS